jgi:protein gp37
MSDLFHPKVPFEFIEKVFCIIKQCPQHTFLILTKRPQRMLEFYKGEWCKENSPTGEGPIPDDEFNNIQIGTTVENQPRADERVIQLLPIPAAVRFVSCTLMGPIDFQNIDWNGSTGLCTLDNPPCQIKWVIIECERLAGNRAGRGCEDEALWWQWAKDIYEQCRAANVAFWLKQGPKNGKVTDRLEDFPAWARIREYPNNSK